jgi:hypothetical protein
MSEGNVKPEVPIVAEAHQVNTYDGKLSPTSDSRQDGCAD